MPAKTLAEREHGLHATYVAGCHCTECRKAKADYERNRTRQRAYGRAAYVDAEPVRAHLRMLSACGVGRRRVAELAGVKDSALKKLMYGDRTRGQAPAKRCRERTAAAILAVAPTTAVPAPSALVSSIGTHRRLQALVAIGWSRNQLGLRLGINLGNLLRVMAAEHVTTRTAQSVAALYDELWDTPPPEGTAPQRQAATRARNTATRHGWAPPLAWDDEALDDSDAQPAHQVTESPTGRRGPRPRVEVEEVLLLESAGVHVDEIARRLGVTAGAVEQARYRAGRAS